jgi:hypothetical protein
MSDDYRFEEDRSFGPRHWRSIWQGNRPVVIADSIESQPCGVRIFPEDARRIIAALNFCRDIPTEVLEMGVQPPRVRANLRPANFLDLSPQEQWEIDKRLGILDWDGT